MEFRRTGPLFLVLLISSLTGVGAPAQAADGTGPSYWGEIPAPADSVTAVFPDRGDSWWTYPVRAPYYVLAAPFSLVFDGVGAGVEYLDDSGALSTVARILSPREVPFGLLLSVQAGGLDGFGGGIGLFHNKFFGENNLFKLRLHGTTKHSTKAHFGLVIPTDEHSELSLGAGYRARPKARFFGVGPEAAAEIDGVEQESYFTLETTWAGATYRHALGSGFAVEGSGLFTASGARGTSAEEPEESIDRVHPPDQIPGFRDRSDGVDVRLTFIHENTVETGRPNRGGVRRASAQYFTSVGDYELDYWNFRLEAQQFLPLWMSRRSLALRGVLAWIEEGQGQLPIQRLYTNDEPDLFRGYRDYRWRDSGLALFTAEYRWPIWVNAEADHAGLDAYLFADLGQVFGEFREISLDHLTTSYGTGLRFMGPRAFSARMEIGFSDEETVIRFKADQVFQFDRIGFYHGRNPIPLR